MQEYILKTYPGLEKFVVNELHGDASILGEGLLKSGGSLATFIKLNSINDLYLPYFICDWSPSVGLDVEIMMDLIPIINKPFRARAKRHFVGDVSFTTVDFERKLVDLIEKRDQAPFALKGYEIEINIDLFESCLLISKKVNKKDLSQKLKKPFNYSNSIKQNICYSLIEMIEKHVDDVIDPFCGSGTIPLFLRRKFPDIDIYATDRDERCVEGTRINIEANYPLDNFFIEKRTFETISDIGVKFGAIVTDPPFGMKMGNKTKWSRFFNQLLGVSRKVLKDDGIILLRLLKLDHFKEELSKVKGFVLEDEIEVDMKDFKCYLVKIRKTNGEKN